MKTHLLSTLILAYCLLTASVSPAQSTTRKFTFGLKAGANVSQLKDLSYQTPQLDQNGLPEMSGGSIVYDFFRQNESRTTGVVGGLFARFGNRLYIQPEVLFSVKGGRFDFIRQGLVTESTSIKIGTIDLPLLLGVRLGPLRLNAGPMASLRVIDGNLKGAISQYTSQPFSQTAKQVQFRYQAGIGLTLAGMQLDFRREGGFDDFKNTPMVDPANTYGSTNPARTTLWQLTVGSGF